MKIRVLSESNPGGVLTDHSTVTPPTMNPNDEFKGEASEAEHQNIGTAKAYGVKSNPKLMQAHQAGSITSDDSDKLHKPVPATAKLSKPDDKEKGEDGMSEMTKAQVPVTAHIQRRAFSNSLVRELAGTTGRLPVQAVTYNGGRGVAKGDAIANPSTEHPGSV